MYKRHQHIGFLGFYSVITTQNQKWNSLLYKRQKCKERQRWILREEKYKVYFVCICLVLQMYACENQEVSIVALSRRRQRIYSVFELFFFWFSPLYVCFIRISLNTTLKFCRSIFVYFSIHILGVVSTIIKL